MTPPRPAREATTAAGGAKKGAGTKGSTGKGSTGKVSTGKGSSGKGSTSTRSGAAPSSPAPGNGLPFGEADAVGAPASKRVLRSQGRRTMRKLLDAAMIAFDKRGYHATRVNDVVEIAKTSHGTFYLYFSNKEDLLRALVTEAATEAQHLYDALNTTPELGGEPQWDDVRGWISAYSELWLRYAPLFRAWTDLATIDPELIDVIRQTFTVMAESLAEQIGPDTSGHLIDTQVAGMAVLAMLDRFHYLREFTSHPIDDVAIDTMTTMVYRALFNISPERRP